MLDNSKEIENLIQHLKYERYALCIAYSDCISPEVSGLIYNALEASLTYAVREIYRNRLTELERSQMEEEFGNEEEIIEMTIEIAGICINDPSLDEIISCVDSYPAFLADD